MQRLRLLNLTEFKFFCAVRQTSSGKMADFESGISYWGKRWQENNIPFHKLETNPVLQNHVGKLTPDGKPGRVYVPMCGKTVDMKWLAEKGFSIVGTDGIKSALTDFCSENKLSFEEENTSSFSVLKTKDLDITLYAGDALNFDGAIGGTFDGVWDRAAFVALRLQDRQKYLECIKSLLKPGGRYMIEVLEYDMEKKKTTESQYKSPPPYAVFEQEMKSLLEADFTLEYLESYGRQLKTQDAQAVVYLATKKSKLLNY